MTLAELRRLNFREIGNWPLAPRLGLLLLIVVVIVAAGAALDWREQWSALEREQATEQQLREQYASKKRQAINIDIYLAQLRDVDQSLGTLLKQLPNKSEMDGLLTDINQAGLGRGLQFELFKPGAERIADFYAELPILLRVSGSYHDFGAFASDVAQMSRIVTLNDVAITATQPLAAQGAGGAAAPLVLEATARTFRYLDEEELAKQRRAQKDAKGAEKGRKK